MTIRLPAYIPMGTQEAHRLSPVDQTIRTDMEVGVARSRRITTADMDRLNIAWRLTDVEMAAFRAWFNNAPWSLSGASDGLAGFLTSGATIAAGVITGPELQATSRLIEDTATSNHLARLALTVPDNANVSVTATVRAAGRGFFRLAMLRKDGVQASATVDLTAGLIVSSTDLVAAPVLVDRGNGWWQITILVNATSGGSTPVARLICMQSSSVTSYLGDGVSGLDLTDVQVRLATGYDLFLPTDALGKAKGAGGGASWFAMPVALGYGGIVRREVRFIGTFAVAALSGFNWEVTANLEVRNA